MNTSNRNDGLEFLDLLTLGSAGLGIYNTILNQKQITNDELFEKVVNELKNDIQEQNKFLINEIKSILKGDLQMDIEKIANAMAKEICAYKMYNELLPHLDGEEHQKIMQIAEDEKRHYMVLKEMLEENM